MESVPRKDTSAAPANGALPGGALPSPAAAAAALSALSALCVLLAAPARAGDPAQPNEYYNLSLEELGDLHITSVSKREERLSDAAASVYVITNDAIRRSGARSLPEALRLAPNLQVARINANQYATSARGFNSSTANKLLVMIDGRTVYTPLYSGVFWDAQNTVLMDIDRIEVVSGPGGTVWGTNAVNGVINIITREAGKTVGDAVQGGSGDGVREAAVRHGGAFGGGAYRLYAKTDVWQDMTRSSGKPARDGWHLHQAGFRADWQHGDAGRTVMGDVYDGRESQVAGPTASLSGANLLARWEGKRSNGASLSVQGYLDRTRRDVPGLFGETLDTIDLDLRYNLPEAGGVQTIFGGGYRLSADEVRNSAGLAFLPARRDLHWSNLFVQHERALTPALRLIGGLRLESNHYTGMEWLPSVKLAWKQGEQHSYWAGLARSVRAPSRLDVELYAPAKPPFQLAGGPDFRSELADTLELGTRGQLPDALVYSATLFHSRYRRVRSLSQQGSAYILDNRIAAQVSGLEAWGSYQATRSLTLDGGWTWMRQRAQGPVALSPPGDDPRQQLQLGASWNPGGGIDVDLRLRHVGALPHPAVPAYTVLDLMFGWHPRPTCELRFGVRNLLDRRHVEFPSSRPVADDPVLVERRLVLSLTASF